MSSQNHNHPLSLVPVQDRVMQRVDSHQNLQQPPVDEAPVYKPHRPEYAPEVERARKVSNRNHRVMDSYVYGPSVAAGGVHVPGFLSGDAPLPSPPPAAAASACLPAKAKAVSMPTRRARAEVSPQAPAPPSSRPHSHSNTYSPFQPSQPSPQISETPQPPLRTPRHHTPSASAPHAPGPGSITVPTPARVPALVHILSLLSKSRGHYVEYEGMRIDKDPSRRDSMTSNGFIAGGQLNSNVAAPLLRYVENPRTKLEQVKQKCRKMWHVMM
jgi:hypothetical protein